MFTSFEKRSLRLERLDVGDYTPEEYAKWQREMRIVNRFLGDMRALRLALVGDLSQGRRRISVLDVGAGSGELLRWVQGSLPHGGGLLVGAELNAEAARSIANQPGIRLHAVQCDALRLPFADDSFDVAVSSLFLHHLNDEAAMVLIREMGRVSRRRFVVIDLHRHRLAYYLYKTFGPLIFQRFTIEDGSLSIRRSFRPAELRELAVRAGACDVAVVRRAAFRIVLTGSKNAQQQ